MDCYGLLARTENTIVDRNRLFAEFAGIRSCGYAIDREEAAFGSICIGAPLRKRGAESPVFAAISVSTPVVRMSGQREAEIVQAVVEAAGRAGDLLYPD